MGRKAAGNRATSGWEYAMSVFDLTEQDIETIKASDEPPQLLAWRYNVA
jgi:hypothetical protein